jgi:hypothetical protein
MSDTEKIAQLQDSLAHDYSLLNAGQSQPSSAGLVQCLGGSILLFCLLVLVIAAWLLRGKNVDSQIIMKMFGLILILCLSVFLMVTGYGQAQLTPIVGLFGTVAGYLLAKDARPQADANAAPQAPPAPPTLPANHS